MTFPEGWARKSEFTIDSGQISSDLVNWTVGVGELISAVLTSEAGPLDADGGGAMLPDGGDWRFTSDEAGENQLAVDIRKVVLDNDPANGIFQAAVLLTSVSSSSDTTFWGWWKKAGESQPAPGSTFGQYNAYDGNTKGVWVLNADPSGSGPQILERTATQAHGTSAGSMTTGDLVDGPISKLSAIDFDGTDDLINCGDDPALRVETGQLQMDVVVFITGVGNDGGIISKRNITPSVGWVVQVEAQYRWVTPAGQSVHGTGKPTGVWSMGGGHQESAGGNQRVEMNGLQFNGDTETGSQGDTTTYDLLIGLSANDGSFRWDDKVNEARLYSTERSNAWSSAVYRNLTGQANFLTLGAIVEIEVPVVSDRNGIDIANHGPSRASARLTN